MTQPTAASKGASREENISARTPTDLSGTHHPALDPGGFVLSCSVIGEISFTHQRKASFFLVILLNNNNNKMIAPVPKENVRARVHLHNK